MLTFKSTIKSFVFALPGFMVFFLFLAFAEYLHKTTFLTHFPFPPVISGMLFFLAFLIMVSAINKGLPCFITRASDYFLPILPLFILPSCVGVLTHRHLLEADGLKIILALSIGLCLTLFATPLIFKTCLKLFPE